MKRILPSAIFMLAAFTWTISAQSTRFRVSQESSPGAGDFNTNVLGVIDVFARKDQTAAAVYKYSVGFGSSYNGTVVTAESEKSKLFFVETSEGITLFVVHDKPQDGSGGRAEMRFELSGAAPGATRLVEDDPSGPNDVGRPGNLGGPSLFQTTHVWDQCCTDGVVIGPLAGFWSMLVQFSNNAGFGNPVQNLSSWEATSADGSTIPLNLQLSQRIRIESGVAVTIDIKPGEYPNSINLGSNGVVPVAILSSNTFDAATVNPLTVTLAGANVALKGKGTPMSSLQDVSGDGRLDLIVHVSTEALALTNSEASAVLEGFTYTGLKVLGEDSVRIVP